MQLIESIPDNKLIFVVDMLENLKAYAGEEIAPDEWDLKMLADAEKENDGQTVSIESLASELGIDFSCLTFPAFTRFEMWMHSVGFSSGKNVLDEILHRIQHNFRYSFFKIRTSLGASLISLPPHICSPDSISVQPSSSHTREKASLWFSRNR